MAAESGWFYSWYYCCCGRWENAVMCSDVFYQFTYGRSKGNPLWSGLQTTMGPI